MPLTDPNLGLVYGWTLGESGWHAGMDANLKRLGAIVGLSVASRTTAAPPASPAEGERYIVPIGATGAWAGRTDQIAVRIAGAWNTTSRRSAGPASSRTRTCSPSTSPLAGAPACPSEPHPHPTVPNPPAWRVFRFSRPPMTEDPKPALVENMVLLRREDFEDLLDRAAERGAERCLAHLGLENGHAARDLRELRDLLEAWRDARRTAWQTTIKVVTTAILAALLVGAALKLKLMGGGQ
jgi:hypothetical protein